jgi:hypothetical protein
MTINQHNTQYSQHQTHRITVKDQNIKWNTLKLDEWTKYNSVQYTGEVL